MELMNEIYDYRDYVEATEGMNNAGDQFDDYLVDRFADYWDVPGIDPPLEDVWEISDGELTPSEIETLDIDVGFRIP